MFDHTCLSGNWPMKSGDMTGKSATRLGFRRALPIPVQCIFFCFGSQITDTLAYSAALTVQYITGELAQHFLSSPSPCVSPPMATVRCDDAVVQRDGCLHANTAGFLFTNSMSLYHGWYVWTVFVIVCRFNEAVHYYVASDMFTDHSILLIITYWPLLIFVCILQVSQWLWNPISVKSSKDILYEVDD